MKNVRDVEVVICCYNSGNVIEKTLRGVLSQKINKGINLSVIIVDNGCDDDTNKKIVKAFSRQTSIDYRIEHEYEPGIMNARKKGVACAKGDILVFVDDDNILDFNWIQNCCDLFGQYPKLGCVGGYNEISISSSPPKWFSSYYASYACGPQAAKKGFISSHSPSLFGAGLAIRTHLIKEVLFCGPPLVLTGRKKSILLRGDDTEICMRCALMGWDLYYDPALMLTHNIQDERVSWDYILQTRRGGGVASILLDIYLRIIRGEPPRSYIRLLFSVFSQAIVNLSDILFYMTRVEGSKKSFNGAFVTGRILGLYYYKPKQYNFILKNIKRGFQG